MSAREDMAADCEKNLAAAKVEEKEAGERVKRLRKELEEAEGEEKRKTDSRKEIEADARKYRHGVRKKSEPKKTKKTGETSAAKNVKQQDVLEACMKVVGENPGIERDELERFVYEHIDEKKQLGMRGYDKRFAEVMKKSEFTLDEDDRVWSTASKAEQVNGSGSASVNVPSESPVESLPESVKVD